MPDHVQITASGPKPFSLQTAVNTLSEPAYVESLFTPSAAEEEDDEPLLDVDALQPDEDRVQREQQEEERLLAEQDELFRQADEAAVEQILAEQERLQTVDPTTGEVPDRVVFDANSFPELVEANEDLQAFLKEEGEWDEEEQAALDEDTGDGTVESTAEQQSSQPAAALGPDEDLYEVFRHPGQMYTPNLETLYGPEYRGFDLTAGRDMGYTPFEFLSFQGDESCEIVHHRCIQVDAPIAKCWQCWADRLNYCEWFDLINQVC